MRREEAAKFVPAKAVKEDRIELKPSWTKGGRSRSIPITTVGQRELIKDIVTLKQHASLIPAKMDYKQCLSHRDHYLAIAGIRKAHGLRHYYAQQRYIALSKGLSPPKLQDKRIALTPVEQALDISARLILSQKLGHARIDITRTYLD